MVYKIVTDFVRREVLLSPPLGVSITKSDNGTFVVSSRPYSSNYFLPYEVISYMAMFAQSYCGRILTATFINEGVVV